MPLGYGLLKGESVNILSMYNLIIMLHFKGVICINAGHCSEYKVIY